MLKVSRYLFSKPAPSEYNMPDYNMPDFRRQNLTCVDFRFLRLKSIPTLEAVLVPTACSSLKALNYKTYILHHLKLWVAVARHNFK